MQHRKHLKPLPLYKKMKKSKSKFLKISCPRCNSEKIIFGKSSSPIKCSKCNRLLLETTGGKAKIKAPVRQIWS